MKRLLVFLYAAHILLPLRATTVSQTKLETPEQRLKTFIAKDLEHKGRVEIERFYLRGPIPPEAEVLAVEPRPAVGLVNFEFVWSADGVSKHAFGTASVKIYRPIVVSKTIIRNSEALNSENCSLQEREISPFRLTGYYEDLQSLNRLRARGYIPPGMVISHNHTQEPFVVNSGENINLIRETPSVKVSIRAKALENGREQQWIRVENLSNRKIIQARVLRPGEVSLH